MSYEKPRTYKKIEIIGISKKSFEDAIQAGCQQGAPDPGKAVMV